MEGIVKLNLSDAVIGLRVLYYSVKIISIYVAIE
jgi:hypothetical protein